MTTAIKRTSAWRFNSRTPRGVRLNASSTVFFVSSVSIHAPREGCDRSIARTLYLDGFQFTHPARGATRLNATEL